MPSNLEKSDIWFVTFDAEGNYGITQNLGPEINTEGRETLSFFSDDSVLYFFSDGHPGLGGLDVFATNAEKGDGKTVVVNLGEPINTAEDDFSFIVNREDKKGYFASNRQGVLATMMSIRWSNSNPRPLSEPLALQVESQIAKTARYCQMRTCTS
ncbi:MAG: hypothetical protein WBG42_13070 [Cryomorphaceae bacterium]